MRHLLYFAMRSLFCLHTPHFRRFRRSQKRTRFGARLFASQTTSREMLIYRRARCVPSRDTFVVSVSDEILTRASVS